jgi:amidase
MVPVGLGGDGGGSIRIPAACCGIFGLKPERGRTSTAPMGQLWWALGTAGPLSRSVLDSALVYDAVRGNVSTDLFTAPEPERSFTEAARAEPGRLRVGWSARCPVRFVRPVPSHVAALEDTARLLADLGHDVREVDPAYPDVTTAFVPQFFAGIRDEADAVEHYERLEKRIREVYRLGTWVRPAVLRAAMRAGERASRRVDRVFADVDVLLTPTIAQRPPRTGVLDRGGALTQAWKAQPMIGYTVLWNVTGHPAASVPAGVGGDGLPLAVQLVGRHGDEPTLLSLAAQLERARPWQLPPMVS